MSLPSKNADLYRRLRLYAFGILLGIVLVKVMYKGKGCQMPNSAKMEELAWQNLDVTDSVACRMNCFSISKNEVKQVLKSGKVNYDKSDVHRKPYPVYNIEGVTATGKNLELVIQDCDTVSKLVTAKDIRIQLDTCKCK